MTDADPKIIKYMDISKFISLLEGSSLYFCRADLLEDKNECLPYTTEDIRITDGLISTLKKLEMTPSKPSGGLTTMKEKNKKSTADKVTKYICSWTNDSYENYALWKIYCANSMGVAIKSSAAKVRESLILPNEYESELDHGPVQYAGSTNDAHYTMRKMKAYSFENEYRFIFDFDFNDPGIASTMPLGSAGIKAKVDLNSLIDEVIVSPFQSILTQEILESFLKKYGLSKKVSKSYLHE